MNRKYTIHFLAQEEPESGDPDDTQILTQGTPTIGYMEFESDAQNPNDLFLEFQDFIKTNCEKAVLEKIFFPQVQRQLPRNELV